VTSRGVELEAVANPAPGLKVIGSFTSYNLFVSKDLNPDLIGKSRPTRRGNCLGLADYTFQSGPLTGFGVGGGVRYIARPTPTRNLLRFPRSCSATPRSTMNGRTGAPR